MNQYVADFAELLSHYNSDQEIQKVRALNLKLDNMSKERVIVADVGCGTGRSISLIRTIWPESYIYALDIESDKINYAKIQGIVDDIEFICDDARDYFAAEFNNEPLDIVLFSWSLFEMIDIEDDFNKEFLSLIKNIRKHMNEGGIIIVLQPTKGGTFEQLLSRFMPDSDEYYLLTHDKLINNGFYGPKTVFPPINDPQAIWSDFSCSYEELFRGIRSVIYLETGKEICRNEYDTVVREFLKEQKISNEEKIILSDCVNMYYCLNK